MAHYSLSIQNKLPAYCWFKEGVKGQATFDEGGRECRKVSLVGEAQKLDNEAVPAWRVSGVSVRVGLGEEAKTAGRKCRLPGEWRERERAVRG